RVVETVRSPKAKFDIPQAPVADALLPCREYPPGIVGMNRAGPAVALALFLGLSDQLQDVIAGIPLPPVRLANPDSIRQRFADRPVDPLAVRNRLLHRLAFRDIRGGAEH